MYKLDNKSVFDCFTILIRNINPKQLTPTTPNYHQNPQSLSIVRPTSLSLPNKYPYFPNYLIYSIYNFNFKQYVLNIKITTPQNQAGHDFFDRLPYLLFFFSFFCFMCSRFLTLFSLLPGLRYQNKLVILLFSSISEVIIPL